MTAPAVPADRPSAPGRRGGVPILMYHGVSDDPAPRVRRLAVRPAAFAAQLAHLRALGFTPLTASGLVRAITDDGAGLPEKPVALTFDDGYADFHRHALPVLAEFAVPATLYVTTGWIEDAGPDAATGRPDRMMTWSQVRAAADAGVEVGAHTHSHPQLDQLPRAALGHELRAARERLEDVLGTAVAGLAYPYGYSNARVRDAVRAASYDYACAVGNRAARPGDDQYAVPRLTVRWSTSLEEFDRIVRCRRLPAVFAKDRALTKTFAVARRARIAWRDLSGRG